MNAEIPMPLATMRLYANDLLPAEVSRILALKPDSAARLGEALFRKGDGTPVSATTGTWFISTRGRGLGPDPVNHLSWLVKTLTTHLEKIKSITPNLQVDFSLLVHNPDFTPSHVPSDLLAQALQLGELEIEVPGRGMDLILNNEIASSARN